MPRTRALRTLALAATLALTLGGITVAGAGAASCRTRPSVGDNYRTTCDDGSSYTSRPDSLGGWRHSGSTGSGESIYGSSRDNGLGGYRDSGTVGGDSYYGRTSPSLGGSRHSGSWSDGSSYSGSSRSSGLGGFRTNWD